VRLRGNVTPQVQDDKVYNGDDGAMETGQSVSKPNKIGATRRKVIEYEEMTTPLLSSFPSSFKLKAKIELGVCLGHFIFAMVCIVTTHRRYRLCSFTFSNRLLPTPRSTFEQLIDIHEISYRRYAISVNPNFVFLVSYSL
jgi:hypothetical protein